MMQHWVVYVQTQLQIQRGKTDRVTVLVPEVPMEVTGDGTFNPWAVKLISDQERLVGYYSG